MEPIISIPHFCENKSTVQKLLTMKKEFYIMTVSHKWFEKFEEMKLSTKCKNSCFNKQLYSTGQVTENPKGYCLNISSAADPEKAALNT